MLSGAHQLGGSRSDRLHDRWQFAHHLLIAEVEDAIAVRFQHLRPCGVAIPLLIVDVAIHFHHQLARGQ